ncbi:MAG: hypothetical protein ACI4XR_02240 [Bacilli bacterium]
MDNIDKKEEIRKLKKDIYTYKLINDILQSENLELKKINNGLNEAYDKSNQELCKYQRYFPYIDKFRNSFFYKCIRKLQG